MGNDAGQWRAANDAPDGTETLSARPLKQPGWASTRYSYNQKNDRQHQYNPTEDANQQALGRTRSGTVRRGSNVAAHRLAEPNTREGQNNKYDSFEPNFCATADAGTSDVNNGKCA
jgi:hypothetical protein